MKNKISDIESLAPHGVTKMVCGKCNYRWVAVHPLQTDQVECFFCGHMSSIAEYSVEEFPNKPVKLNKKHKKQKGQSKLASLLEAKLNTAIGFIVSLLTWKYIVPIIWPEMAPFTTIDKTIGITVLFTVISIARNYFTRRFMEWRQYGRK